MRRPSEPAPSTVEQSSGPSLEDIAQLLNNAISPLANQLQQTQAELLRVSEDQARLRGSTGFPFKGVIAEPATEEGAGVVESEAERRERELRLAETGAAQAAAAVLRRRPSLQKSLQIRRFRSSRSTS